MTSLHPAGEALTLHSLNVLPSLLHAFIQLCESVRLVGGHKMDTCILLVEIRHSANNKIRYAAKGLWEFRGFLEKEKAL